MTTAQIILAAVGVAWLGFFAVVLYAGRNLRRLRDSRDRADVDRGLRDIEAYLRKAAP